MKFPVPEMSAVNPEYGVNLLEVKNLKKYFLQSNGILGRNIKYVKAVDDVSFSVKQGETFGLVGESGCGKTTTGKVILRLLEPTSGEAVFNGRDIFKLNKKEMRQLRREIQIIFQDPYSSLSPKRTVSEIIAEPLWVHGIGNAKERAVRVKELLDLVGLASYHADRYPHEFSGGQRQRIGIARAIALNPKLIICDEPVSALDVSIQSQIINLLQELQREIGLTYVFIAHGLAVVKHISTKIGVMYLGKMMEIADSETICSASRHPYTRALMSAVPIPDPTVKRERIILSGDVPSPLNPPAGCQFHTRCFMAKDICREKEPELVDIGGGHFVACHFKEKLL